MAKKPTIQTISTGYYSRQALNNNFEELRDAFDNTLSLDGSTPNAMQADLDMNGNDIINASSLTINGQDVVATTAAALASAQTSLAAAQTAETNAEASEAAAALSETNAASSETNAASSAASASTSETNAATSAAASGVSATASAASAAAALASETAAATSEANAATSATNAASSATAAAGSASTASAASDAALAALDSFDDRYLGQKASDPTLDNDGDALVAGALYFNTTDGIMKVYDGSVWVAAYASLSGAMLQANNLSDVLDVVAARTNLGLATVAATGAYSDLTGIPAGYGDTDVDTHLNTGTAATGEYLSWNGADYDWATVPAGYADADVDTHLNTGTATTDQVLAWTGSDYDWVDASAGATGGGTDKIFVENGQVVTTNYTVSATTNAMTTGPIDINAGVTVTVETGGRWVVI